MLPIIIGAVSLIAYGLFEENNKPKAVKKMAKGGDVDMYSKFDLNKSGNFFAKINSKNYEIIYRDDKSQMYDLFENNKKIKSNRNLRNLMKFPKMAKGGAVNSFDKIFAEYEDNEDNNYHSENVVLLAENFGSAEDLKLAKSILKKHESEGSLSGELGKQRYALHQKLYPKLIASKPKMAKGGNISKGKKWKQEWKNTKGGIGYDILEIENTKYFSNSYNGGVVIRSKIIESSEPKRVGNYQEDNKKHLTKVFLGEYPFANKMAKGGIVVTSIKDIPNFKERNKEGKITYRGLGLGKLFDDFYNIAGEQGVRIKVDGKEYFITDTEFNTFSRGSDGKMRIRFDAPYKKGYANGGNILGFEAIVKKALKENNKWHFINEEVDGKNVQLKMYVGAKEVDVQIFKINGIHHGKMNYQNKTKTLAMIMGELK